MQSAKSNKLTSTSLSVPKPVTNQSSDNPEDHSQLKDPLECGMLVPVEPGLDPSVVIPLSTETEQKSTEPTIAHAAQLASAIFSKDPVAKNVNKGNNSLFNLPNQIKCHILAYLIQNLQTIRSNTILLLKMMMRLALTRDKGVAIDIDPQRRYCP
jgi:hypothetical protein